MLEGLGISLSRGVVLGQPRTIMPTPQEHSNSVGPTIGIFTEPPSLDAFFQAVEAHRLAAAIVRSTSPYSHLAWAASYLAIPTIIFSDLALLAKSSEICIDFDEGRLFVPHDKRDIATLEARIERALAWKAICEKQASEPAVSRSGSEISFLAQLHSPKDVALALHNGAAGVGEIKSELFTNAHGQVTSVLNDLVSEIRGRTEWAPVPIRFFDFSADKLPKAVGLAFGQGQSAYRGVRILEIDESLMAVYTEMVGDLGSPSVVTMLPMVTDVAELTSFIKHYPSSMGAVGVTIETPAAALTAHRFLDITRYAEVGLNERLSSWAWSEVSSFSCRQHRHQFRSRPIKRIKRMTTGRNQRQSRNRKNAPRKRRPAVRAPFNSCRRARLKRPTPPWRNAGCGISPPS